MSFMENQVLGYKSPLYGRRTAQFLIRPFDYKTSAQFVPSWTAADKAVIHGITGGVPKYLELIDPEKNLRQNIIDLFLKESGYLFEEPGNLLKQELREAASYNAVIEAIAAGATKVSEIAGKAKIDTSTTAHCLEVLISLGIVAKEMAITEESNKRKTYYSIQDTMFRFWYRFIPGQIDAILSKEGEMLYDEVIEKELPMYMGKIFEDICKQYLMGASRKGTLPLKILKIGRWWGNNPKKKREEEIDLVGLNLSRKQAIFGECKYRNERLGKEVLDSLLEKAQLLKGFEERFYILFSKSGFTPHVEAAEHVLLVSLEDMY